MSDRTRRETSSRSVQFDETAHQFLEEVEGEAALSWVRHHNQRSLDRLKSDTKFEGLQRDALAIVNASDRIPYGNIRNGHVYNFWQDEGHVRGIWRRTTVESYVTSSPQWDVLLDVDDLAEKEGKNWVFKGADCLMPEGRLCLITLSNGGKDAAVQREFDIATRSFVEAGFNIPEAKSGTAWVDKDTILLATDWGPDSTTQSGYPFIVKALKRGQLLQEASEVVRGTSDDVGVWPMAIPLDGAQLFLGAVQADSFFTRTYWWFSDLNKEPTSVPLPPKATIEGAFQGHMLVSLEQDWTPSDSSTSYLNGDLVAFDVEAFMQSPEEPLKVKLVLRPEDRQAIAGVTISKNAILVSMNDNVNGKVLVGRVQEESWNFEEAPLPETGMAGVAFASIHEPEILLNYNSFLTPDSLYLLSDLSEDRDLQKIKALPDHFDAAPYCVEQFEAVSSDGTRVPYFLVRSKDIPFDGSTPVLQYGYGGFQISLNPAYSGFVGKLWLDRGGAYVLANIRGGGEFGPAWHQAGLKTKRQAVYDDFIAVSEDLVRRRITSPRRLGIMGGSNGGLLMGVMAVQRPDLYEAIVCQVPLLDMLRFHTLLAGASWVDEYGSPEVAEERKWLEELSPYHNLSPDIEYPEIFFVTSTKDDRVHPAHARKMAHRLHDLGKPFLYYENIDGGHSAAANLREDAHRRALEMTYLMQRLMD